MDGQESLDDGAVSASEAAPSALAEVTPKMALAELPKFEIPKIEIPKLEIPKLDPPGIDLPAVEMPAAGMLRVEAKLEPRLEPKLAQATKADAPKRELAAVEAPRITPEIDDIQPAGAQAQAHAHADTAREEPTAEPPRAAERAPIVSRFTLLAASLALAAGLGGMVGALVTTSVTTGFTRAGAPAVAAGGRTGIQEFQALKENVVQARVELAAIKAGIDAGNRNASAQFTRIAERVDRIERQQAEPAARLNKAVEAIERLSRADASPAKDVTGSIPSLPVSGAPKPLGAVDGWILRDVRRGTALIEGRMGIIEVDQGDVVPGLGRIDAIRKQADGRWVVVTTRGLVMPPH
jgi:hypothetical protein